MDEFIFETARLELIPFSILDSKDFHQINTDAYVRKYMWDDEIIPISLADEIMQKNNQFFSEKGFGIWKIISKKSKKLMGYTGLWYFFDEPQPQLIYALLQNFTGEGFATEAAISIVDYAFNKLNFNYLIVATDEPHLASQKVAKRLGFKFIEKRIENDKPTLFFRTEKKDFLG